MTGHLDVAIRAAQDRKAVELNVLSLQDVCAFTDFFVICSGTSTRHTQAISDAIQEKLKGAGLSPTHVEGYSQAEWILLDYLNFVVHIFTDRARHFYDLERLWKKASRVPVPENGQ
jgi:ribosome-associated protein